MSPEELCKLYDELEAEVVPAKKAGFDGMKQLAAATGSPERVARAEAHEAHMHAQDAELDALES